MKRGKGQNGSMNWGHPGRKFKAKDDPLGDMGVGNRRPMLIALAIGLTVASVLFLAWESRTDAQEAAAAEAGTVNGDSSETGPYGSRPSPSRMREDVEKLLKGDKPNPHFRVLKPEERPPADKPVLSI